MTSRAKSLDLAPGVSVGGATLATVAGPCVIESEEQLTNAAQAVADLSRALDLPLVFKASYDKANRSSVQSFRGPGMTEGLRLLAQVSQSTGLPLLTDVHEPEQCAPVAEICNVLQIPAFLCRQTDLIVAAAATGRAVNIKKGQFMAPEDMVLAVEKARSAGCESVTVTERGSSFGYHNLVVDMRSFSILHSHGIPVLFDVTHSLQLPGARGTETGGRREFAEPLARAAVAAGADGVYLEVHPNPDEARSDSATQLDPQRAQRLLAQLIAVRKTTLETLAG
jgi:2-dehydro-3-deoxyphosphooctonate aldolase (KDO 8-P synthase)